MDNVVCGGYYAKEITTNNDKVKINLSADGYDIELDLLSEILYKKINYVFIPLNLPESDYRTHSSFSFDQNIKKMKFLLNKYKNMSSYLEKSLKEFIKLNKEKIKRITEQDKQNWSNYIKAIKKLTKS